MNSKRLYFIDIIRAFAILMMLQGHFINTLLADSYKDINAIPYSVWSYFRGITAPTFFTISGLIFTYLLLKAKEKGQDKLRMRKGIVRGFFLIGVGYLLRIPFLSWFSGYFNSYFLVIDVLQCIGLSLIIVVVIYYLCAKRILLFSFILLALGFLIFLSEPLYRTISFDSLPALLNNYLSKSNGSIFTITPWFGYIAFGAYIATLFHKYAKRPNFKKITVLSFFILGWVLIICSSDILILLHRISNIQLFIDAANYNYLFTRLGNVLLYFSFFYAFENYLKFPLILKIGQKTLSIYVIHFTIIYGSFFGIGLNRIIGKTLTPWPSHFWRFVLYYYCLLYFFSLCKNKCIFIQAFKKYI